MYTKGNPYNNFQYDPLVRIVSKTGPEGTYTWQYVTSGNGLGNLNTAIAPNGNSTAYEYDNFARITKLTENIDGQNFDNQYEYDNFGNLTKFIYPSGYTVQKNYDNNGYLTQASAPQGTIFTSDEMNALNQYTKYTLGNGKITENSYNDFGMMFRTTTAGIQDLVLNWNTFSGNLAVRGDNIKSRADGFLYDNLNRLITYDVFGPLTGLTVDYANNGNISSKTDVGNYTYNPTKPHAVQSVTDPLGLMPLTQNITYTPFKRPATITEGDYELTFTYGPGQQRKKSLLTNLISGVVEKTITYAGNFEKIETLTDVYEVHYINADPTLAINVKQNNGSDQLFYAYRDHLGSILTLTDATGNVVYEQNFDPWGRERNPNTWDYTANPNTKPPWLIRGFTGHEHHNEVELINMNARLYDPIVARMLSPDNFVQDATSTQGYNRYSYVLNNPLVYVDSDGENPFLAVVVIVGVVSGGINLAANWNNVDNFWDAAYYFGVGAAVGAGATVGGAALAPVLGTGAIAGATLGAASGFTLGFANTAYSTGGDWNAALNAGGTGALYGGITGGVIAGTAAGLSGRNVWTGAQPTPGQSVFSFKQGLHSNPSFKFGDAYSLRDKNFWKYGHTNVQDVTFAQDAQGNLVEATSADDFARGESLRNPSNKYQIRGNTVQNADGTFTTTITKQSYQTITNPIGGDAGAKTLTSLSVSGNTVTFNTINRADYFIIGGQVPRNYGGGFYSIFQIR